MTNNKLKGIIYLLITALIWGGSFISQLVGGTIMGSFTFSAYRCFLGCITIAVMIIVYNIKVYGKFSFFRPNENKVHIVRNSFWCGLFLFFAIVIQQIGVEMTDAAKSGLITSLEVICVPILMWALYKKKIRIVTWLFIFTAMFGIMMLSINSLSGVNLGDILVFISTVLYSITILQVPKYAKDIDPLKFSFFRFVIVSILSFISAIVFNEEIFNPMVIEKAKLSIFYSGVMSAGVAYTLSIVGQKYCEPIIATLIMSLEGIFAAILGWIILGQSLKLIQIIGIIIAFVSIIFVQLSDQTI